MDDKGEIRVRAATPADHEAIRELTLATYLGEDLASPMYTAALTDVAGRARDAELLVAEITWDGRDGGDERGSGSGSGSPVVVGSVAYAPFGSPYGEILVAPEEAAFRMLAVSTRWRGRGAGELLVQACLERARAQGCRRVVISTEAGMVAAGRMYARLGFRRVPERDWSPHPGVDLICLSLELDPGTGTDTGTA